MVGGLEQSRDGVVGLVESLVDVLRSPVAPLADELRAVVAARNALDAVLADGLNTMAQTREFEVEGASSIKTWARRELLLDGSDTAQLIRSAQAVSVLPAVGEAFRAGALSAQHLRWFSYAITHVGDHETTAAQDTLLEFAADHEPAELGHLVKQLRDVVCPDDLDQRWVAGMDRADIHLAPVMEGWHLSGFLPQEVGARFEVLLRSWAVPTDADDLRTPAQRRLNGFDRLLEQALADGLPTDGTVRPQIHVTVDAGTLKNALHPANAAPPSPPSPSGPSAADSAAGRASDGLFGPVGPATLVGFGSIGPKLLSYLTCGAQLEPILINRIGRNPQVLDVGRTQRLATTKQRTAIWFKQTGQCAAPGCRHPISHIHHIHWYSRGGPTDLDNLVGLCGPCHRLTHTNDHSTSRSTADAPGHSIARELAQSLS